MNVMSADCPCGHVSFDHIAHCIPPFEEGTECHHFTGRCPGNHCSWMWCPCDGSRCSDSAPGQDVAP